MEKLPKVRDYMDTRVPTLRPEDDIIEAIDQLLEDGKTGAPVVDAAGRVIGILTEKDCLRLVAEGSEHHLPRGTVAEFMTRDPETIPPDMDIYYAAGLFLTRSFRRLPVLEDGKLVGAITRYDILRAIEANRHLFDRR